MEEERKIEIVEEPKRELEESFDDDDFNDDFVSEEDDLLDEDSDDEFLLFKENPLKAIFLEIKEIKDMLQSLDEE